MPVKFLLVSLSAKFNDMSYCFVQYKLFSMAYKLILNTVFCNYIKVNTLWVTVYYNLINLTFFYIEFLDLASSPVILTSWRFSLYIAYIFGTARNFLITFWNSDHFDTRILIIWKICASAVTINLYCILFKNSLTWCEVETYIWYSLS